MREKSTGGTDIITVEVMGLSARLRSISFYPALNQIMVRRTDPINFIIILSYISNDI